MDSTANNKLIYIFDPLCGWCYGFGPVMRSINELYGNDIDIEVLSGGMSAGDRVTPVEAIRDYIKTASGVVTEKTGVIFGKAFFDNVLDHDGLVLDSEPPSIALEVFRDMNSQVLDFSSKLQEALFLHGKPLNEDQTYIDILRSFDVTEQDFLAKLRQPEYRQRTYEGFEHCRALGVTGYPTLIAQTGDERTVVSRGYQSLENLKPSLEHLIKQI